MRANIISFLVINFIFTSLTEQSMAEVNITPHRAFYSVSLKSAKEGSSVRDTFGKMMIEIKHGCDGWTLKQNSASVIDLKSEPSEIMRSEYTAWESSDGKKLKFNTKRIYNESESDSVNGTAGFNKKGGTITYDSPEPTSIPMMPGTLPPITHMKQLIESAQSGKSSLSQQVFDGSFFGNPVQINTFIGKKKEACDNSMGKDGVWPMNLAVYAMPSTISTPNFEITQKISSNGIMCSYIIDFGDYKVEGVLDKLEYLPQSTCSVNK